MTEDRLQETKAFFHSQIPITAAMGVRVESYDGHRLILTAPLSANHNHLGTAFGGSLAAIATLAGYGLLWLELGDRSAHLVIRDSTFLYRRPVRRDIRAICCRPSEPEVQAFRAEFERTGKGRITLQVTVEEDGEVAVRFEGTFVAML